MKYMEVEKDEHKENYALLDKCVKNDKDKKVCGQFDKYVKQRNHEDSKPTDIETVVSRGNPVTKGFPVI